jgi:hypothetical protein
MTTSTTLDVGDAVNGLIRQAETLADGGQSVDRVTALAIWMRAVEIRIADRLQPVIHRFPATIQGHFTRPDTPVVGAGDAYLDRGAGANMLDLLELLGETTLSCISPRLYRGWQDRNQARIDARKITGEVMGFALDAGEREALLAALALRNRVFMTPPPVDIEEPQLDAAVAAVRRLVERVQ